MPKRTTIFIIILAIITAGLLFLAVVEQKKTQQKASTATQQPAAVKSTAKKETVLSFSPSIIILDVAKDPVAPGTADVAISSGTNKVTGVQLEMSFDPKVISSLEILPSEKNPFFASSDNFIVLFEDIDYKNGRASFAIALNPGKPSIIGVGNVATVNFSLKPGTEASQSSISLLNKTVVTEEGSYESVLKQTSALNITLAK